MDIIGYEKHGAGIAMLCDCGCDARLVFRYIADHLETGIREDNDNKLYEVYVDTNFSQFSFWYRLKKAWEIIWNKNISIGDLIVSHQTFVNFLHYFDEEKAMNGLSESGN